MKPHIRFVNLPQHFWAAVRLISEEVGYSHGPLVVSEITRVLTTIEVRLPVRPAAGVQQPWSLRQQNGKTWLVHAGPPSAQSRDVMRALDPRHRKGWNTAVDALFDRSSKRAWLHANWCSDQGSMVEVVCEYLNYRQTCLKQIEHLLMDKKRAKAAFDALKAKLRWTGRVAQNKQKGDKAGPAYLTGIVNMLVQSNIGTATFDKDPQSLTTFTRDGCPVRTLTRRLDGAFPSTVNPIAVWEIKEYYNSKTFGSRVAGGVYETILDGIELKELRDSEGVHCRHYIFVDDHHTWWNQGRSYLCRFIDALHLGYADEVLFGREVLDETPRLAKEWVALHKARLDMTK
ncbi:MAG TPA: hypothetical protein PKE29_17460 [Phycisphaerales bacterium]|nr:hypothetical protein [Phycisphaerales bacterium]